MQRDQYRNLRGRIVNPHEIIHYSPSQFREHIERLKDLEEAQKPSDKHTTKALDELNSTLKSFQYGFLSTREKMIFEYMTYLETDQKVEAMHLMSTMQSNSDGRKLLRSKFEP